MSLNLLPVNFLGYVQIKKIFSSPVPNQNFLPNELPLSARSIPVPQLKRQSAEPNMLPCAINHWAVLTTEPPIAKKTIKVKLVDLLWYAINHSSM